MDNAKYSIYSESTATLYSDAITSVKQEWGAEVFDKLGSRSQRALIAEEILYQAFYRTAIASPETVKNTVRHGWLTLVENYG